MSGPLTPRAARRPRRLTLAAALGVAAASTAWAADVTYPPSRSLADVAAWLQRDTPLRPDQIVDVSPQAVTAVTAASPMGQTRGFLASISSEAVDPQMLAHDGIASWTIPVEIDCDRRLVRLGVMTGFKSRDLVSEPRKVREADTEWVNPTSTAPLGAAIRALCDRDFHRPLAGKIKAANRSGPEPKPGPPPIVEVRPRKVAEAAKAPPADGAGQSPSGATASPPATPARAHKPPQSIPIPGVAQSADDKQVAKVEASPPAKLKAPAGGGASIVQIGASPSESDAQALLARFKKKFGAELGGLKAEVVAAQVDGKTVHRAQLAGFANYGEANAYCKGLADAGQACFIRR